MHQFHHVYVKQLYQLYHRYKERDFVYITPLVLLALYEIVGHFFWLLRSGRGLPHSADSKWYLDYANALMTNCKIGLHMNDILYFGYNTLLTLLLVLFKDPVTVVFIQAITASFSVILVYKIANMLFNRTTAVIASVFYYKMYDITLWSMYILSDSFFISLQLLCVYLLLKALDSNKKKYKLLFVVTALYMLVFRPTGVISMFFILVYIATRLNRKTVGGFVKRHSLPIGCLLAAVAIAGTYLYTGNYLDPLIKSIQYNAKLVLYNVYAKGWIYDYPTANDYFFRPDYTINIFNSLTLSFIINNGDHIVVLYGKRMLAFLGHWVWKTNLKTFSGLLIFAGNILPTVLFLIGTIAVIRNGLYKRASIVWLLIFAVFVYCTVLFVDWMYRYRAPAIPFIAIAAAYGAAQIIIGAHRLANKYTRMLLNGKRKNIDCNSSL